MAWEQHSHADGETFTADDMNRMEEAIYDGGGYSSKKEWADGNVPGVEGWNRLENGILAIGSDKVSQNLLLNTQTMQGNTVYSPSNAWTYYGTEDGFGIMTCEGATSGRMIYMATNMEWDDSLVGKIVSMSMEIKADSTSHSYNFIPTIMGSNNGTTWAIKYFISNSNVSATGINADTWTKLMQTGFTWPAVSSMTQNTSTEYAMYRYALGIRCRSADGTIYMRKPKLEIAESASGWSPNPADLFTVKTWESEQDENNIINADNANRWEQGITDMLDYREKYATEETETATPQSIPDDTEDDGNVAAPEAEEIE